MSEQIEITDIVLGEGKAVVKGALITAQYTGWLEDGTKFDSSYDRGQAFQCVIGTGRVIKGWDIGLMGMKVGGKRKLTIPSKLAYGDAGSPPKIPGKATLVFDIELLSIGEAPGAKPAASASASASAGAPKKPQK